MSIRICAVVVTFNRLGLLKNCIDSIRNQSRKVDEIIVVNNSSTDGTFEWLSEQKDLTVITQPNSGSAGGQYTGIKSAYEKGYDWIWCLDTDVIPNLDALQKFFETKIENKKVGFLSSNIFYPDGNLAYANIPELGKPYDVLNLLSKINCVPILSASFGSVIFPRHVIKEVGLPCKEFFIWGDDAEFTLRIVKYGFSGFLILESTAIHFNPKNEEYPYQNLKLSDKKFQFGIRNMVYISIMRNEIVYHSKLRGILSALGFVNRIFNQRRTQKVSQDFIQILSLLKLFLKGLIFNPKYDKIQ